MARAGGGADREAGATRARASPASEQLLDAVIASLPDAAIVLDRDEPGPRVQRRRARAIAPALARGAPASLALRVPEVVEAVRDGRGRQRAAQRRVFAARAGRPLVRWRMSRPLGAAPRPALMLLVFHDLTPLHRVEEMRADFVANASHELRTPLASLSGFIDTLQGPARDDAQARARFLAIMKTQATRMARLIDDLLSLSRVELIEHMHPETPVDLVPIVRQVVDGLQTLARDRNVEIADRAAGRAGRSSPGDRDELTRVFENLIENALKYGASGKRVDIGFADAAAPDGAAEALVTVRDYGPGIAAEHMPRLTERFYRVDVTQSRAEGGTGLGPRAGQAHPQPPPRQACRSRARPGKGATFTVRLPLIHSASGQ